MVAGVFGLSLLQFAFLGRSIQRSVAVARDRPLRAFLVGVLALEVPILVASLLHLGGARELAALLLVALVAGLTVLFWPAAISYQIGQRLAPEANEPGQVLAGSAVLSGTLLIPIAGWLWLLGLALLATGGCCLRGRYA
jgi:hypothetical protein